MQRVIHGEDTERDIPAALGRGSEEEREKRGGWGGVGWRDAAGKECACVFCYV